MTKSDTKNMHIFQDTAQSLAQFIDELYELGVRDIILSPGSRSTPLAMLFSAHKFKIYMNIDERSAAFFALGIAKAKNFPTVIVCTSGSAPAHYLPAIIEAKLSRIPLIVLTADRPAQLQDVGAPQTINQKNLFSDFIKYFTEFTPQAFTNTHTIAYARLAVQKAFTFCQSTPKAPVHINIPLSEPLIADTNPEHFTLSRQRHTFSLSQSEAHAHFDCTPIIDKKGLIICGAHTYSEDFYTKIIALAKHLNAPLLADPLSNLRNVNANNINASNIIDSYDAFLKSDSVKNALRPEYILLFGQAPVSKRLFQFLSLHADIPCYQIDSHFEYRNPALTTTHIIQAHPKHFAQNILESIPKNLTQEKYLEKWLIEQKKMRTLLDSAKDVSTLFEGNIIQLLQELTPDNAHFALANSMTIRDIDFFWKSGVKNAKLLCNRGTNGIEGTISTALGIASTSQNPTILITGDLAFFHDMNGLLMGKTHNLNLIIILLNNNGGGIFQYLPQVELENFEYLFRTPHGINFSAVASLYNINMCTVKNFEEFCQSYTKALQSKGLNIIEIPIDMSESKALHAKYTTPK